MPIPHWPVDLALIPPGLSLEDFAPNLYALLAGRTGGQTLHGGNDILENLTLKSTSGISKGAIIMDSPLSMVDQGANPSATGRFQRNSALLKYHDGTAVRTLVHDNTALGGHATGTVGAVTIQDGTTSQKGVVQLDADNGENAARAVNGQDTRLVRRGTSFPGSPADGWHYYRTDLDELFEYDGTRAKWLSVREFTYEGAHTSVNNAYLNFPGGPVFTSTRGYNLPYDMVLCELHITNADGSTNGTFRVRADGSNVTSVATNAATDSITTGINDNYSAGAKLQFFTSSNIAGGCAMKGFFRRRAA